MELPAQAIKELQYIFSQQWEKHLDTAESKAVAAEILELFQLSQDGISSRQ